MQPGKFDAKNSTLRIWELQSKRRQHLLNVSPPEMKMFLHHILWAKEMCSCKLQFIHHQMFYKFATEYDSSNFYFHLDNVSCYSMWFSVIWCSISPAVEISSKNVSILNFQCESECEFGVEFLLGWQVVHWIIVPWPAREGRINSNVISLSLSIFSPSSPSDP